MVDYGHDLQFGFFLDPSTGHPERTVEIARILDELTRARALLARCPASAAFAFRQASDQLVKIA